MAAASVRDDTPAGGALWPAAAILLGAASHLHRAASAIHQGSGPSGDPPPTGDDLARVAGSLRAALQPLLDLDLAPDPDADADRTCACACAWASRQIGRDLLIRVQRVEGLFTNGGSPVDRAAFCSLWTAGDVDALGSRLADLRRRYRLGAADLDPGDDPLPRVPLAQLSLNSKEELREEPNRPDRAPTGNDNDDSPPEDEKGKQKAALAINSPAPKPRGPAPAPDGVISDFILDSLAYKSMHDREDEVVEAHGDTLEWIFDASRAHQPACARFSRRFASWLSTDALGPIYWVTGKPGSGKSTLMRFLHQHASTMRLLRAWAGDAPVATAGFFFWTSGSRQQRSQTGLLRSLLHQLLSAHPGLVARAFGPLWERLRAMTTKERVGTALDWTAEELRGAFRAALDAALPRMRICLFVDGLDELEGDHLALVDLLRGFALGEHGLGVKMCLSSRPWAVFESAFQRSVPNLRLQDLTRGDMCRYARDRLRESPAVRSLFEGRAPLEGATVEETVQRADGVFLWVRLAVNEMLDSFQPKSVEADLVATLRSLPTELDALFEKLLFEDQHPAEIAESAALFQLIRAREVVADFLKDESSNSLTVWELAFALNDADDTLAIEAAVEEATDALIHSRCKSTVETITQRFRGLLELHGRRFQGNPLVSRSADPAQAADAARITADTRVTYIHRTVRDWLASSAGMPSRLSSAAPPAFDPHLRLLRSYVLRLKRPLDAIEHHRRLDDWYADVALAMTHARHAVRDPRALQRPLLNALDATLSWLWRRRPANPHDHWAAGAFGPYELRMRRPPVWQPFLCLATKFGLARYVRDEVDARAAAWAAGTIPPEQRELERPDATPLLAHAVEFLTSRAKTIFPLSDPGLVEDLLRRQGRGGEGLNPGPNHGYVDLETGRARTAWVAALRHLRDARRRGWVEAWDTAPEGTARWARVVRLLVEVGGADVRAVVERDSWDPEISALGVLEMLEETYGAVELRELRELVVRRMNEEGSA